MASPSENSETKEQNTIAMELLQRINVIGYTQVIPILNFCDVMTPEDFKTVSLSDDYWLDTRNCYLKNNQRDPDAMFRLFGNFSNDDPETVRLNMIEHVNSDKAYYDSVAVIALSFKRMKLDDWLEDIGEPNTFGDEISLYVLCRMYNRHAIIYTRTKSWSTIGTVSPIPANLAHNYCDVHLLHMGCGVFGKLTRKPMNTTQMLKFGNPKLHVFIDKRRKFAAAPEDLSLPRDSIGDSCVIDEYLSYESDNDHCPHKENTHGGTLVQSDTETDVSSSSMHMNNVWSEEEQSSFTDAEDQVVIPEVQVATIKPIEQVIDTSNGVCPVHGTQNVFDTDMTDGNEMPNLQDIVKTYLLSEDYPQDITLEMINRFCAVPLKRLVIKIIEPEQLKPVPDIQIKNCTIKLRRLQVDATQEEQPGVNSSDDDTPEIEEHVVQKTENSYVETAVTDGNKVNAYSPPTNTSSSNRPKRNGTQIKSYVESNSDEDAIKPILPSPKPKRKTVTLRSPSASRIAAQKSKKNNIKPIVTTSPTPPMTRSRTAKVAYIPPKLRPRNTKEKRKITKIKGKSATPAKPEPTANADDHRGDLDIKFKGLPKYKKPRKFTCKECENGFTSQASLNAHHIQDHQPVKCPDCVKVFATPSTLARHSYIHRPLKYCCEHCPEKYAFQSALERHLTSHRKYPTFICHHKNCGRAYFSNSELIKHVRVHEGKVWKCHHENCDYENLDQRLLTSHLRKHSERKPYVCGVCGKGHRYHIQFVRHVKNDNCDATAKT